MLACVPGSAGDNLWLACASLEALTKVRCGQLTEQDLVEVDQSACDVEDPVSIDFASVVSARCSFQHALSQSPEEAHALVKVAEWWASLHPSASQGRRVDIRRPDLSFEPDPWKWPQEKQTPGVPWWTHLYCDVVRGETLLWLQWIVRKHPPNSLRFELLTSGEQKVFISATYVKNLLNGRGFAVPQALQDCPLRAWPHLERPEPEKMCVERPKPWEPPIVTADMAFPIRASMEELAEEGRRSLEIHKARCEEVRRSLRDCLAVEDVDHEALRKIFLVARSRLGSSDDDVRRAKEKLQAFSRTPGHPAKSVAVRGASRSARRLQPTESPEPAEAHDSPGFSTESSSSDAESCDAWVRCFVMEALFATLILTVFAIFVVFCSFRQGSAGL